MKQLKSSICLVSLVGLTSAYGAGFEKTVMWGGKWAGLAGAAAGAVTGGDSLFYNPAGLAQDEANDVGLSYSPILAGTKGAQTRNDEYLESKKGLKNIFGVTSKYSLTKDWAMGLGAYVSGGVGSKFENVDYSGVNARFASFKPTIESNVSFVELGLGTAYRFNSNFSAGVTYRTTLIQAKFSEANISSGLLVNTRFNEMEGTNAKGLRLGAQYLASDKKWGLGASYRSSIDLEVDGSAEATVISGASGDSIPVTGGKNVHLNTVFPQQINAGGFYKYNDKGTVYAEYSWTDYSKNQQIDISGDGLILLGSNILAGKSISMKWQDAHCAKFGHEYNFGTWDWRAGYAFTGPVTSKHNVSITFSAPAYGHSVTTGFGKKFMNDRLHLDMAGEYSAAKGNGTRASNGISGEYMSYGYGLHSSLRYFF